LVKKRSPARDAYNPDAGGSAVLALLVTAEKLVAAVARLQDGTAGVLGEAETELASLAWSLEAAERGLASAARLAGSAARGAASSVSPIPPFVARATALSDAALRCSEACDQVARSAEAQLARRAELRGHLERISHHLRAIREADAEMRLQQMGTAASVGTLGCRLELSARVHHALDAGEKAISGLRTVSELLLEPERVRLLQAEAGRETCRATAAGSEYPLAAAATHLDANNAGGMVVSWHRGRPDIARIFPASGLRWSSAERELHLCFVLEERVRSPGILSVVRPAFALWNEKTRHGTLVQYGVLRWRSTPTSRSGR
jgi:hypothetical protein